MPRGKKELAEQIIPKPATAQGWSVGRQNPSLESGVIYGGRSTAVVLFLLVAINPKDAAYGSMPLFYAGGLVIVALAFNRASAWAARQAPPQP